MVIDMGGSQPPASQREGSRCYESAPLCPPAREEKTYSNGGVVDLMRDHRATPERGFTVHSQARVEV